MNETGNREAINFDRLPIFPFKELKMKIKKKVRSVELNELLLINNLIKKMGGLKRFELVLSSYKKIKG